MTTVEQLTHVFNDNFMAYINSHIAHLNIEGRNFYSDHKLLQEIYEDLQDQIDTIGELLRSINAYAPTGVFEIADNTNIDTMPVDGIADNMLNRIKNDLTDLSGSYESLMPIAEAEGHQPIANYCQDRLLALSKYIWMLNVSLA